MGQLMAIGAGYGRFGPDATFASVEDPAADHDLLVGRYRVPEPHLQLRGQGYAPVGGDGFGHRLVEEGGYDAAVNESVKALPGVLGLPAGANRPIRGRRESDMQSVRVRGTADEAGGLDFRP